MITHFLLFLTLILGQFIPITASSEQVQAPTSKAVVRAVLFYSPTCSHCHYVITEVLPPLAQEYGEQLQIIGIDITQADGQTLFRAALAKFGVEEGYIPFLVIGDTYLVGSANIPNKFRGLIDQHLSQGGIDWPDIPGLAEVFASMQAAQSPNASPAAPEATSQPTVLANSPIATVAVENTLPALTPEFEQNTSKLSGLGEKLERDPLGNALAVIVLIGMIISLLAAIIFSRKIPTWSLTHAWSWTIPILCLIGMGVAGYLAYVETSQVQAVCGPVGDCNAVQQSEYARLFGILPIGILGLVGFAAILLMWGIGRFGKHPWGAYASLAMLGLTTFGLLFSIYLTFLEPFVIGATCAWCLTSAILMTALFWLSLPPSRYAFSPGKKERYPKIIKVFNGTHH